MELGLLFDALTQFLQGRIRLCFHGSANDRLGGSQFPHGAAGVGERGATARRSLTGQPTFDGWLAHPVSFGRGRSGTFATLHTGDDSFAEVC